MGHKVKSIKEIGALIRNERLEREITQAQASGLAGVGVRFFSELENGKATLEVGKVLKIIQLLGFDIYLARKGAKIDTDPSSIRNFD